MKHRYQHVQWRRFYKSVALSITVSLLAVVIAPILLGGQAEAAGFAKAFVRFDRLTATTPTGGRVCAQPTTTITNAVTVKVTFPTTTATDYVVNSTVGNWSTSVTNLDTVPSAQTAWPNIASVANTVVGKTVSWTMSGTLTIGTLYCFNFAGTNTLTTSSANAPETIQGDVTLFSIAPALLAETDYSKSIISNDQLVLNATVPPSFTFVLSGNTDNFTSNLSTGSVVSTSGKTVTITTNAASGWIIWVKGLNNTSGRGALQSATAANYKIVGTPIAGTASRTLATGTEDYGLGVIVNTDATLGGTVSIATAYDGTASKAGTIDAAAFRPVASSNGTANGDIVSLYGRATIAGQTPAANDYTDTMTIVGAGQF